MENVSDLGPSFSVSNLEAPSNATVGDTISVSATITNPTSQQLTQPVDFRLAGTVIQRQNVTLDADQSTTVTFEVPTTGVAPGTYPHGVYARNFGQIATITVEAGENATDDYDGATTPRRNHDECRNDECRTTTVAATTTRRRKRGLRRARQAPRRNDDQCRKRDEETTQAETRPWTSAGNERRPKPEATTQAGTTGGNTTNASVVASVLDAFGDLV